MKDLIDGIDFSNLVAGGAKNLANDKERINALNVFPVPDGDTGSNMSMTIEGGAKEGLNNSNINIGELTKAIARAMVLSARGNSGVILSQFFKGVSISVADKEKINVKELAEAFKVGARQAYSVVSNPTEGTILTVMREAGDKAYQAVDSKTTIEDYLKNYIKYADKALMNTPNLLPVLKEAGVIDSGGAGFLLVIEGMLKYIKGEDIEENILQAKGTSLDTSSFNADSILTYGYCTEFILQLQNSKVNPKTFDLKIINDYLDSIGGNSVVSFKDDDIIKVHVHTFDPGLVLHEFRKYGEYLTVKIENMNVQHTDSNLTEERPKRKHKKYAVVAVASGNGIVKTFKDIGVDEVIPGGQTMNTSTEDFINAFNLLDCEYILVYPNNSNIIMAANQACEAYDKAKVIVIPSKTIPEGYSAISMLNFDNELDDIINEQKQIISSLNTLEVTYAVRDAIIDGVKVVKDYYICIYNNKLLSCNKSRIDAMKEAIKKIENISDMQVFTIFTGKDSSIDEINELNEYLSNYNPYVEIYPIPGDQELYSYIIGIE